MRMSVLVRTFLARLKFVIIGIEGVNQMQHPLIISLTTPTSPQAEVEKHVFFEEHQCIEFTFSSHCETTLCTVIGKITESRPIG